MTGGATGATRHVELYVRSVWPRGDVTGATLDRLATLADRGEIDSYDVVVWGDRAPPTVSQARTPMGRYVCQRLTVFREWARRNDLSLGPGVRESTVDSEITGETTTAVHLPAVLLAVYEGDHLHRVVPFVADGEVTTVPAYLQALADGEATRSFVPVEHARVAAPKPGIVGHSADHPPTDGTDGDPFDAEADDSGRHVPPRP